MIWVVAGTKMARDLVEQLLKSNFKVFASTTTAYGEDLIENHENLKTISKAMSKDDMMNFIDQNSIKIIIDSSHPFAVDVSQNVLDISEEKQIPLIRYERKEIGYPDVKKFDDYISASKYLEDKKGNVLLTIGSKNINYFKDCKERKVYVRVLPIPESIETCMSVGFSPDNIIAMKFPFSKKLNKILYDELNIKYVVTKDSGEEGGVVEKIEAAFESGVEVLMIKRPKLKYKEIYYEINDIIERIRRV